jgi:IS605 OrfB family transposase
MAERAFQTARFKVHNPSRHKRTMLLAALEAYHLMAKKTLETALQDQGLVDKCSLVNRKDVVEPNGFATAKYIRTLMPKGWNYAPLRDYLISDLAAALMSHLAKQHKGKNESNPPTVASLEPMSDEQYRATYTEITQTHEFEIKPEHKERIAREAADGHSRVAKRLECVFRSRATTKAVAQLLRTVNGRLPRPIEFRHCEFKRGFMLATCNGRLYCLMRLFSPNSRYAEKKYLSQGFVDLRSGEDLSGKAFPGVILPLEMGRDFHQSEYLTHGSPQSAKLLARMNDAGEMEFYVHVAFEFKPTRVEARTILGIDRGAAKIGAASVIDWNGDAVQSGINLEGDAFAAEMKEHRRFIAESQRRGIQKNSRFKLRKRRADAILGEYANALVRIAQEHQSLIVLEKIDSRAMARFLTQSQFAKLKSMLEYKTRRVGLPEPMEVPAARTSQTCAGCGHWSRDNRTVQALFRCVECHHEANADENASLIISFRGLHQKQHGGKGGKFQKWGVFELWLKATLGRDGQATVQ